MTDLKEQIGRLVRAGIADARDAATLAQEREIAARSTDAILSLLSASQAGWRPIETAPKDGTPIVVIHWNLPDRPAVVWWDAENTDAPWRAEDCAYMHGRFTHWTPLPPPPEGQS